VCGSRVEGLAEMLIEDDRFGREPSEVPRFDPVVAAATDEARMKVVETNDEGARRDFGFGISDFGFHGDAFNDMHSASAVDTWSRGIVASPSTTLEGTDPPSSVKVSMVDTLQSCQNGPNAPRKT